MIVGGIKFTVDQKEARERSKIANDAFTKVEKLLNDAQSKLGTNRESAEVSIFQASEELKNVPVELEEDESKKLNELQAQVLGVQDSLYKGSGYLNLMILLKNSITLPLLILILILKILQYLEIQVEL